MRSPHDSGVDDADVPVDVSIDANSNAGGGGGGIGSIYVRTTPGNFTRSGLATPTPGSGPLRTQ